MDNTALDIKLLEEIPDPVPPDYQVKLSVKFIRDTMEPNQDLNIKWIEDVLKGEQTKISYVCDICEKEYETLEEMDTVGCKHCKKYFDYCKTHVSVTVCPFCNVSCWM